jgi:uncharacterized damage-inducible protein DinB
MIKTMKNYYLHLLEYNDWANQLILEVLKENPVKNDKILSIFSHLIIAQILWLNRVKKEEYEYKDFWQKLSLKEMEYLVDRSTKDWVDYLIIQNEEGLERRHFYKNTKGKEYSNTLAQILTHVINHSTYHRAQVASYLRLENINPPLTDYIAYFR